VNWEAISAIGQLVGALAVVISLIYLAREVRSNARDKRGFELISDALAIRSTVVTANQVQSAMQSATQSFSAGHTMP
jgi:flagellar biogenesis protein FliO